MKRHTIDIEPEEYMDEYDAELTIATIEPATEEEVRFMLALEESPSGDTRSQWAWVRLADGHLIFGCFPQGDSYELVTQTMLRGRV